MLNRRGEGGYTLIELLVAMSIMLVVLGAILAGLESGTAAESRTSNRIDEEQGVDLVLAQFARDVRSATGLESSTNLPDEVDLAGGTGGVVRWVYDPSAATITRYVGAAAGVSLQSVVAGTSFEVDAADGTDLSSGAWTAADVLHCAAVVRATVVTSEPYPERSFTETGAGQLHPTFGAVMTGAARIDVTGAWPGCP
jgi:prepilin-type N-terminal cleavage/methylation domain-containing protein